jgi:hypothetical protein
VSASTFKHFLLVYDHALGRLVSLEDFADGARALEAYSAKERMHLKDPHIEIVLIGADSLDTVRVTHANYFEGSVTSPYLLGL